MTSTRPSQLNAVAEVQEVLRPLESSSRRETPPSTTPVLAAETEASGSGATLQDISFCIIPLTCRFLVVVRFEWRFFWSLFFLCFFPNCWFSSNFLSGLAFRYLETRDW